VTWSGDVHTTSTSADQAKSGTTCSPTLSILHLALLELSESEHALNSPAVGTRAPPKAYIFMPFSNYRRERVGSVTIAPTRNLEAGSLEEITITFMAGDFGIDDTDAIKMSWHTASESSCDVGGPSVRGLRGREFKSPRSDRIDCNINVLKKLERCSLSFPLHGPKSLRP
jgi:hypothetical protein